MQTKTPKELHITCIGELTNKDIKNLEKQTKARKASVASEPINEVADNSSAAFSERRTRWDKELVTTIRGDRWWILLDLSIISRSPWEHLHAFLQSDPSEDWETGETHLSVLVCVKFNDILCEFSDILLQPHDKWTAVETSLLGGDFLPDVFCALVG